MSDLSDERLAEIISEMEVGLFEPLFREVLFMARELQARRAPPTAGDVERMLEGFKAIHRWLSPSDRTFDELIRAVGIADDIARAAIAATLSAAPSGDMWQPIKTAPTDGTEVLVYAPPREGLKEMRSVCAYHPDAGWCIDELREVTLWQPLPTAPSGDAK